MSDVQVGSVGLSPGYSVSANIVEATVSIQGRLKDLPISNSPTSSTEVQIQKKAISTLKAGEEKDKISLQSESSAHDELVTQASLELLRGKIGISTFIAINSNPNSPPFVPLSWLMRDYDNDKDSNISLYI